MQAPVQKYIENRKFKSYIQNAARNIGNVPTETPSLANVRLVYMHNIAATSNYVDDFVSFNEFQTLALCLARLWTSNALRNSCVIQNYYC